MNKLEEAFNANMQSVISIRNLLKKEGKYDLADEIRGIERNIGVELIDTKSGTIWRKKTQAIK